MTLVDCVFPLFIFISGISIPLAIDSRRRKANSWPKIWFHIALRTIPLLFLGVLMVNDPNGGRMGWLHNLWNTLMYATAIVAFLPLPLKSRGSRTVFAIVRCAGARTSH